MHHNLARVLPWKLMAVTLLITGCTRFCATAHEDMSPEEVVEAYLDIALNMTDVSERELLQEYTTGNLKSAIEGVSVETIKKAYIEPDYKTESYSVIERRDRTPRETEITFQLTYHDLGQGTGVENAPKVTTENTVIVVREKKLWLIRDVLGNKTAIDFPVAKAAQIGAVPGKISDPSLDAEPASDTEQP